MALSRHFWGSEDRAVTPQISDQNRKILLITNGYMKIWMTQALSRPESCCHGRAARTSRFICFGPSIFLTLNFRA